MEGAGKIINEDKNAQGQTRDVSLLQDSVQ